MITQKAYKNSSGITMVALVITIVILMILGTITIVSLNREDSTINQAINAKESADYKQAKTEVNEEWFMLQNETRKQELTNSEKASQLEQKLNDRLEDEDSNSTATVTYQQDEKRLEVSYKVTDPIYLSLEDEPTELEPGQQDDSIVITAQPQDVEVLEGNGANFSVTATVKGNATYQWYYNNENSKTGGDKITGATQSTYAISQTSLSNDGYYYCEITSNVNGATVRKKTDTAKLTVKEGIKTPTISPDSVQLAKGKTLNLEAQTSGAGELKYQWFYNSTNSNEGGTQLTESTTNTNFEKTNMQEGDTGYYYCVATQTYNNQTRTAKSAPASVTVVNSEVTYEYAINQTYPAETYTDTGYKINWDNDFTIETTVNVPELGKRYMIVNGYDGNSAKELQIDFYTVSSYNCAFRVFMGYNGNGSNGHQKYASGSITPNEDIKVTFTWNSNTHSYVATAKGTTTDKTLSYTIDTTEFHNPTGMASNTLRIGCVDYRGRSNVFNPITVKSLKITEVQDPNATLRVPTVDRLGWTFNGWYTAQAGGNKIDESTPVPQAPTTYYAQYADSAGPEITNTSVSNTLDTSNYVDFTAIDNGVGITGYNITSTDQQPTNWIPVVDAVEEHTETKWQYDAAWARVFHHNNHWGMVYFADDNEAKSSDTVDKYSVLGDLDKYKNNDNKYEFLLQYPQVSTTEYNRWIQNDNPATLEIADTENGQQVPGYTAVHTDWTSFSWRGLAVSTNSTTYIDGGVGHWSFWYSIGAKSKNYGSMPGPTKATAIVNLWSRIDNKISSTTINLTRRLGDLTQNGTYYIWVKDVNGNISSKTVEVNKVDTEKPLAEITSTNNVATQQTVTLKMGDNNGVVEYYWGTQDPSNKNIDSNYSVSWTTYNNSTNATETKTVNDGGRYYLGVKDAAGNIKVVSAVFHKTTLNPGSATVDPATIITPAGSSVNLPDPTDVTGYDFNGWFTDETGGTQVTNPYTPTASTTLYAHHSAGVYTVNFAPNGGNVTPPSKTVTYGQTYGTLPEPTREGYQFLGWNGESIAYEFNSNNYTINHYKNRTSHEWKYENNINYIRIYGYQDDDNIDTMWIIYDKNNLQLKPNTEYTLSFQVRSNNAITEQLIKKIDSDSSGKTGIFKDGKPLLENLMCNIENDLRFSNDGNWHTISTKLTTGNDVSNAKLTIGNDYPNLSGVGSYIDIANIQIKEGDTACPYYVTADTTVTIPYDHTLTAIWQDVTNPTVTFGTNGNSTPSTTASTAVTINDSGSGANQSTFKYLWTTRTSGVTKDDFIGTNSGTFTQGGVVTLPSNNSGDYYLYIYAKDNEGNPVIGKSNKFVVGNMQPGATVSQSPISPTWGTEGTILTIRPYAIKVEYDSNNTRTETQDPSRIAHVSVNGDTVTITNGVGTYTATENGTYTIVVTDVYGNTYSYEQAVGNVDMTPPTINANNITFGQNLVISIADAGSGVKGWQVTNSATAPTSGWTEITATSSINVSKAGLTAGTWYVWAKDVAGNTASKKVTVYKHSVAISISPTSPVAITNGNTTIVTATVAPAIIGTWNVSTSTNAVQFISGNNVSGTSYNIKYQGQNAGDTEITVKFTPSDASYETVSMSFTQTVIAGNYSITSGGTKTYYNTMALALAAIPNNGSGTIVQELDYADASSVTVSDGKNVKFDNNGKTLTKQVSGITVNSGTTLEVAGDGIITTEESHLIFYNKDGGTLNLTHTGLISYTYTGGQRPIVNEGLLNKTGSGTIISNGTFSTIGNFGKNAVATISDGIVKCNNSGAIHNYGNATLNISNTAVISSKIYAVQIGHPNGPGILNITGGKLTSENGSAIAVSQIDNSIVNITNGEVIGKNNGIVMSVNGTVTIGNTNDSFNTNNPVIQGGTYGLNKTAGTWNFYNGIIKGGTADYTGGEPAAWRSGYDIKHDTEGDLHTAYLKLVPTLTVASTTTVQHNAERTLAITYNGDGNLTATSSNNSVATARIEGSNLIITGGNVGTATITVSAGEGNSYLPKTATCTVTVGTTPLSVADNTQSVIYDGSPHGISLEIEPSGTTTYYSTSTQLNSSNYSSSGSTTMPTRTDVGSTTVHWYVAPDSNTNYSGVSGTSTITITKADITPTINMANYTYGGTKSTPTVSGNPGNGTPVYYYSTSNSNANGTPWTNVTSSTSLNAGDYYMYAVVPATTNYNGATTVPYKFTIEKKAATMTLSKTTTTVIEGNTTTFTITYDGDGALSVASSNGTKATATRSGNTVTVKGEATGTAAITVTATAGTNYAATAKVCDVTVEHALYQISSGTNRFYRSLADAVSAVSAGGTIKVLDNTEEADNVTISKNVTIDTNGKTMTRTAGTIRVSGGTTTVSGNGTIDKTIIEEAIQIYNGSLKTSGTPNFKSKGSCIVVREGTATISGGTVYSTEKHAIGVLENGTVNISGGTISNSSNTKDNSCIIIYEGTTNLTGGNVTSSTNIGILINGNSTLNVSGDGTVTSSNNNAIRQSSGTTTLSGGTLTSTESTAISITGGTMTASGATINAPSDNGNGVYVAGGTFNLTGGAINAHNNGIIADGGTANIGDKDVAISRETPAVTANMGLSKSENGTWNFYNGVLKGADRAYDVEPNAVRDGSDIMHSTETISETTYNTAYLNAIIPIYTAEQMKWVGDGQNHTISQENNAQYNFSLNGTYLLKKDIDLSTVCSSTAGNWTPIGPSEANAFTGEFNGDGHKLSNLYINTSSWCQGLFGYNRGNIHNLTVEGNITSTNINIGGITAYNYGEILNCNSNIAVIGSYVLGGITSRNYGEIIGCSNYNKIEGTVENHDGGSVGGIACVNYGLIEKSYNEGNIVAKSNCIGGIAGSSHKTINMCVNNGNVTSQRSGVGGIAGYSNSEDSQIINCYNLKNIANNSRTGGIVGDLNKGNVTNCYSIGTITGTTNIYSILGGKSSGTTTANLYYLSTLSTTDLYATPRTEAEMKNLEMIDLLNSGQADAPWTLDSGNINNGYPILKWQKGEYSQEVADALKIESNTSKWVQFAGNSTKYRVLYDATSPYGIEVISDKNVGEAVELGKNDPAGNNVTGAGNANTSDRAIWSYTNAIDTLNKAAEERANISSNLVSQVRCVGSRPSNKNFKITDKYYNDVITLIDTSYFTTPTNHNGLYEQGEGVYQSNGTTGNWVIQNHNYTEDWNKMETLGIKTIGEEYWLASRIVRAHTSDTRFNVRYVTTEGGTDISYLFYVDSNGIGTRAPSRGVRPVCRLAPGVQITGGNGTEASPYILGAE